MTNGIKIILNYNGEGIDTLMPVVPAVGSVIDLPDDELRVVSVKYIFSGNEFDKVELGVVSTKVLETEKKED